MSETDETASESEDSEPPSSPDEPVQEEAGAVLLQSAPSLFRDQLRPLLLSVPVLTLLTGVVFPLALAAPARLLFPQQSAGSLVVRDRVVVGSRLIGQADARPGDFHPRRSAAVSGYDAIASGGTNLGPINPRLREDVRTLAEDYRPLNGHPASALVGAEAIHRPGRLGGQPRVVQSLFHNPLLHQTRT